MSWPNEYPDKPSPLNTEENARFWSTVYGSLNDAELYASESCFSRESSYRLENNVPSASTSPQDHPQDPPI